MRYDISRASRFKDDDGKTLPAQKLGVFEAEDGVDIAEVQQHLRSGDFTLKPEKGKTDKK